MTTATKTLIADLQKALGVIGHEFWSRDEFVVVAQEWLAEKHGDLQIEHVKNRGWEVSTRNNNDRCDGGFIVTGDGTLTGCLCAAVLRSQEATKPADDDGEQITVV